MYNEWFLVNFSKYIIEIIFIVVICELKLSYFSLIIKIKVG